MRAISLWQPWASLWLSPAKVHETRHWSTNHRGYLGVHAAKKLVSDCGEDLDEICIRIFGPFWRTTLPRGAVIGRLTIVHCLPTENIKPELTSADDFLCGNFTPGRYGWRRSSDYRLLAAPVPWAGRQGLFDVPDNLFGAAGPCDQPSKGD